MHHLLMRGLSALGEAVAIVELPWAVKAEPDVKSLRGEEARPCLVDERAIGLDAVDDAASDRQVFFLQRDDLSKVVQA